MPLDLNQCDKACIGCIKRYKDKHSLVAGQSFDIQCEGIDKVDEQLELFDGMSEEEKNTAKGILDPVTWAAQTLDWHCLDPDGEVWKRKNPDEYYRWIEAHPNESVAGHSRYHRPYQAEMLRCTSQYKVFRIGRQAGKTEALVVSALYHLFTKPNVPENEPFKIVVIAPYQAQVDLIFNRMLQLIRSNPVTHNSLRRHVKAPIYTIELNNSSTIRGFTAGTRSGGNAEAVRGQSAHMLIFDEADYLAAGDMDAAMSITTNHPDASVWMSSTPSGKRERFYSTCFSKQFREFYYPSQVNPMWDERQETLFREQLTELGYKHEVEADFGEQEEGVFQNVFVQAAKARYEYGENAYHHTWTYTMGVDWNDTKNGTCIVVLGFNPNKNTFYVVDRHTVSREGWTQLAACQKVAELNRIWKPIAIYIDSGFGGTQWEILRKYGYDSAADPTKGPTHPDAKLKDIVKKYEFGGSLEVRDLFTKQPIKKPAKSFLVESTVRRFEAGDIKYPASDELLERQLLGYIVARVSVTGVPVYEAGDATAGDHVLDALMCSIVAVVLEVSPFGKPRYTSSIAFSGKFGEVTTPQIFEGDTVVHRDRKHEIKQEREGAKPEMGRTEGLERTSLLSTHGDIPARHLTSDKQISLWDWPGFARDEPRPRVRSLGQAEGQARKRIGFAPRMTSRPRRKNI